MRAPTGSLWLPNAPLVYASAERPGCRSSTYHVFRGGNSTLSQHPWLPTPWRSKIHLKQKANHPFSPGWLVAGGDEEDGDDDVDWEEELRRCLKELDEMKELEKRAEELVEEGTAGHWEETEEEERETVRKELKKVAKEQAERRRTAKLMFELGQKAYEMGMYSRAIEFLEGALTIIPGPTLLGGEMQIWLAMDYEANNHHRDCIALEKLHPSVSIRCQTAELRYIL